MSKPTFSTRISKIKIYEAEAKSFPSVLDFMYCGSTLSLSADQAHILYIMADTLDIPQIKEKSKPCGYLVKNPPKAGEVPPSLLYRILHKRAQCINVLKKENPGKYIE
jgi:hypothetical protein